MYKGKIIQFICSLPNEIIYANDRKEAVSMVRNGKFKKYKNVVVLLSGGERFNLQSQRGLEYFGIKSN